MATVRRLHRGQVRSLREQLRVFRACHIFRDRAMLADVLGRRSPADSPGQQVGGLAIESDGCWSH